MNMLWQNSCFAQTALGPTLLCQVAQASESARRFGADCYATRANSVCVYLSSHRSCACQQNPSVLMSEPEMCVALNAEISASSLTIRVSVSSREMARCGYTAGHGRSMSSSRRREGCPSRCPVNIRQAWLAASCGQLAKRRISSHRRACRQMKQVLHPRRCQMCQPSISFQCLPTTSSCRPRAALRSRKRQKPPYDSRTHLSCRTDASTEGAPPAEARASERPAA